MLFEFVDHEERHQSFTKLCGLVEGFRTPDEVTIRAFMYCIIHATTALYMMTFGILMSLSTSNKTECIPRKTRIGTSYLFKHLHGAFLLFIGL